jgi:mRNA interferase MazF
VARAASVIRRGDLVTVALQGDLGKPRPALEPNAGNGLQRPSQVMVDKPQSVQRQRLGPVFGRVDDETMLAVNRALAVFLGLA